MYIQQVFDAVKKHSPILYWIVIVHLFLALVSIMGSLIDDRTLMGINIWIKPFKFSISNSIYILTVGFLITLYPYSKRKKNLLNNIVSWTLLIEAILIICQASRGVQSHYNTSNPIDGLIFAAMGIFITINVFVMVLFIFDTMRLKLNTSKLIQWAILIGWLILFFGSLIGGQMISQMSHNVGVKDGGPGLPLVNWSTIAGDLRVAHFFGLHGLQVIPIFALLIINKCKTTTRNQFIIVTIFGLAYTFWIGYIYYQAKQGIPFINM